MNPSQKRFSRRGLLVVLALSVLAMLIVTPQTRWLLALQAQTAWRSQSNMIATPYDADRVEAVLRAHPADLDLHIGAILLSPIPRGQEKGPSRLVQLRTLAPRFPNSVKIYAYLLRYMTSNTIKLQRDDENELRASPKAKKETPVAPTSQQFADYDNWAAQGERLEPDNAYFPAMRAIGLFAQHQDEAALAAIHRAGNAPHFRDYATEEDADENKLLMSAYGPTSALARVNRIENILFPHYSQIRALARMTTVRAMRLEQQGRVEAGIAVRTDIRHIGEMMRSQNHSLIGFLVGIACAQIIYQRPGGAPPFKPFKAPDSVTQAMRDASHRKHLEQYVAFLKQSGHTRDALDARNQYELGERTKTVLLTGTDYGIMSQEGLVPPAGLWLACQIVLANLVWLLIFGCGAWLASCFRSQRAGQWFWNIYINLATPISIWWVAIVVVPGVFPLLDLAWNREEALPFAPIALLISLFLAVPLGTSLVLFIASRVSRVPTSIGEPRGWRGLTLPLACVLILMYSVLVTATALEETHVQNELNQMMQHEGQYIAERSGQQWP